MLRHQAMAASVLFLVLSGALSAPATTYYVVRDLGTLGGASSYAYGINDAGQVVGWSDTTAQTSHAFLFSGGVMQDLGTLGGNNSCAYGINNAGQVVGQADTATTSHAFLYSVGNMSDLGDMCGGTGTSVAYGINNSGVVVGQATARVVKSGIEYRPGHAFVYGAGGMQDLGTLPWDDSIQIPPTPSSEARAISDSGQIVGVSDTAVVHNGTIYATNHAFSCRGGQMDDLYTLPPDFTVVGPATSVARAVNVGGDIAGWSTADVGGDFRPFLYTQSGMQGLGSLGGMNTGAYGINTGGQIVGLAGSTGVRYRRSRISVQQRVAGGPELADRTDVGLDPHDCYRY